MNIKPFQEYPRMHLQRDSYTNLNGLWDLQICSKDEHPIYDQFQSILVPFVPGTAASLYTKKPETDSVLWYQLQFAYLPNENSTFLNFEAVDQSCTIYLNGVELGSHQGSFDSFRVDVSSAIKYQNLLVVKVWDNQEGLVGYQKEFPFSGIYGTVWLEDCPKQYIEDISYQYDSQNQLVKIELKGNFEQAAISLLEHKKIVHQGLTIDQSYEFKLDHPHLWSPEDPFLYNVYVQTEEDVIKSYLALRTIENQGGYQFYLNHNPYWINGVIDVSWFDESGPLHSNSTKMEQRLQKIKSLGFQAIRKSGTLERNRWFYLCDTLGILVFQEIPSLYQETSSFLFPRLKSPSTQQMELYLKESSILMEQYQNHPSLVAWLFFAEKEASFSEAEISRIMGNGRFIDVSQGHRNAYGDICWKQGKGEKRICFKRIGRIGLELAKNQFESKNFVRKQVKDIVDWNQAVEDLISKEVESSRKEGYSGYFYEHFQDYWKYNDGLVSKNFQPKKIDELKIKTWNHRLRRIKDEE